MSAQVGRKVAFTKFEKNIHKFKNGRNIEFIDKTLDSLIFDDPLAGEMSKELREDLFKNPISSSRNPEAGDEQFLQDVTSIHYSLGKAKKLIKMKSEANQKIRSYYHSTAEKQRDPSYTKNASTRSTKGVRNLRSEKLTSRKVKIVDFSMISKSIDNPSKKTKVSGAKRNQMQNLIDSELMKAYTTQDSAENFYEKKALAESMKKRWLQDQGYSSKYEKRDIFKKSLEKFNKKLAKNYAYHSRSISRNKARPHTTARSGKRKGKISMDSEGNGINFKLGRDPKQKDSNENDLQLVGTAKSFAEFYVPKKKKLAKDQATSVDYGIDIKNPPRVQEIINLKPETGHSFTIFSDRAEELINDPSTSTSPKEDTKPTTETTNQEKKVLQMCKLNKTLKKYHSRSKDQSRNLCESFCPESNSIFGQSKFQDMVKLSNSYLSNPLVRVRSKKSTRAPYKEPKTNRNINRIRGYQNLSRESNYIKKIKMSRRRLSQMNQEYQESCQMDMRITSMNTKISEEDPLKTDSSLQINCFQNQSIAKNLKPNTGYSNYSNRTKKSSQQPGMYRSKNENSQIVSKELETHPKMSKPSKKNHCSFFTNTPGLASRTESPSSHQKINRKKFIRRKKKNKVQSMALQGKALQMKYTKYEESFQQFNVDDCLQSKQINSFLPNGNEQPGMELNKDLEVGKSISKAKKSNRVLLCMSRGLNIGRAPEFPSHARNTYMARSKMPTKVDAAVQI
ncbi:unnamed protein product [Moneuplotes crassus]|uniref:Uncharacterized protein n=1 Tax=Euplotes crassus TaxID=5936 RepID=A0AAD1Y3K9_EUPCR|nr:unnamed protein product [Moneuplotes crassus]